MRNMEIGYEESRASKLTFEQVEQKFQKEIMRMVDEQVHLDDEEIAKHKEVSHYVISKIH